MNCRSGDERESGGERGLQEHDGGDGGDLLPVRAAANLAEGAAAEDGGGDDDADRAVQAGEHNKTCTQYELDETAWISTWTSFPISVRYFWG